MPTNLSSARRNVDSGVRIHQRYWRRVLFDALNDARRSHCGVPTSGAILARWWIEEYRPERTDRHAWRCSFGCACEMLGRDETAMREHLLRKIDAAQREAMERHVRSEIYIRKAMVMACAGYPPRAIARQYLMPLVDAKDYDDVAGVDRDDQYALYDQREDTAA